MDEQLSLPFPTIELAAKEPVLRLSKGWDKVFGVVTNRHLGGSEDSGGPIGIGLATILPRFALPADSDFQGVLGRHLSEGRMWRCDEIRGPA